MNNVRLGPEYFPNVDSGIPVASGSIYVGKPDTDPTVVGNRVTVTGMKEDGTTVTMSQPISTSAGGIPLYNGSPVVLSVYGDYSLTVLNSLGSQVYYVPRLISQALSPGKFYYADPNEANQGVAGSGYSIKDIVDSLAGATATLYLAHSSGSSTTPYVFGTDETIPETLSIIVEPGASIAPASGVTVTIGTPDQISANSSQRIFTGDGTIAFTTNGTMRSSWWGDTGDGTTDDYGALNAAFTALALSAGGKLIIGPGFHLLSAGLTWQGEHTQVECQGTLSSNFTGAGTALTIGNASSGTRGLKGNVRVGNNKGTDWATAQIGVLALNLAECTLDIDIGEDGGFQTGLKAMGDNSTGNQYNKYFLGVMWNLKIGVHTFAQNSGWCNENTFYGGRFSAASNVVGGTLQVGSYHIKNEHGNNNTYFRPSFEQQYYEYYMYSNDDYTTLIAPRMESSTGGPTYNIFADTGAGGFNFLASYFDPSQLTLKPSNGYVNLSPNGWHMAWDRSTMRLPSGNIWNSATGALPTSGSFKKGDIHQQNDANFGNSVLQVCTSNGTYSSATDNTGDTDGSTAVITGMTDTSDFYVGEYVTVSAGFAAIVNGNNLRIISKTSTTITLDANSTSAQSNVTVATVDPTWVKVITAYANNDVQTVTYASEVTPDLSLGRIVKVSPTGNLKIMNPTNVATGHKFSLYLVCDGSNRDITFDTWFKATAFTLTANKRIFIEFMAVTSTILVQISAGIENN